MHYQSIKPGAVKGRGTTNVWSCCWFPVLQIAHCKILRAHLGVEKILDRINAKGQQYMLVILGYATRYPEDIPLSTMAHELLTYAFLPVLHLRTGINGSGNPVHVKDNERPL